MIEEKCKTGINKGRKLSNEISGRSLSKRKVKKKIKTKQNTECNKRNKNHLLNGNNKRHMIKAKILHTLPIKEMKEKNSLTDKLNSLLNISKQMNTLYEKNFYSGMSYKGKKNKNVIYNYYYNSIQNSEMNNEHSGYLMKTIKSKD